MPVYRMWTIARRKPGDASTGNSDHVIVVTKRVMTVERRAWRKEKVANEEIRTGLRIGQPIRTQCRKGAESSFQASRNSSKGSEESERAVQ